MVRWASPPLAIRTELALLGKWIFVVVIARGVSRVNLQGAVDNGASSLQQKYQKSVL